jgi:hypothetical protein
LVPLQQAGIQYVPSGRMVLFAGVPNSWPRSLVASVRDYRGHLRGFETAADVKHPDLTAIYIHYPCAMRYVKEV